MTMNMAGKVSDFMKPHLNGSIPATSQITHTTQGWKELCLLFIYQGSKLPSSPALMHTGTFIVHMIVPHDIQGFPGGSDGKESTCNVGDLGSIPRLGRSPGEGKGYPLHFSGLENSMDCIVCGVAESRTRLSDFHFPFHNVHAHRCSQCTPLETDTSARSRVYIRRHMGTHNCVDACVHMPTDAYIHRHTRDLHIFLLTCIHAQEQTSTCTDIHSHMCPVT